MPGAAVQQDRALGTMEREEEEGTGCTTPGETLGLNFHLPVLTQIEMKRLGSSDERWGN